MCQRSFGTTPGYPVVCISLHIKLGLNLSNILHGEIDVPHVVNCVAFVAWDSRFSKVLGNWEAHILSKFSLVYHRVLGSPSLHTKWNHLQDVVGKNLVTNLLMERSVMSWWWLIAPWIYSIHSCAQGFVSGGIFSHWQTFIKFLTSNAPLKRENNERNKN